jgi:queuine tRNA-ribosyltransferase
MPDSPTFSVLDRLDEGLGRGRTGVIHTAHGQVRTPAFLPVATQAAVKMVLPEAMRDLGAQALLANAYHLYLQPGIDIVREAGGLGRFMHWDGPTFTDSGGFQVMSLGAGFKKTLAMDSATAAAEVIAPPAKRLALVDDDGVTFRSHRDGTEHRFTAEVSMQVQHAIGADVIFAFDELTTLLDPREYQEQALERTHAWARRCVAEHERLGSRQLLFGVLQGADHEDLRRATARELSAMGVAGFGIGGAIDKRRLSEIIGWVVDEVPDDKPRHLLGIGEPDDLFAAVAAGADTFDCVTPARVARNAAVFSTTGRFNINTAPHRRRFEPIDPACECYTCTHYTAAYLHHVFKAGESLAGTLATIHNEHFIVRLVDRMRRAIAEGDFAEFREDFLGRYYAGTGTGSA